MQEVNSIFSRARLRSQDLRKTPLSLRLNLLGQLREVILEQKEHIIDRITKETKKTRTDAITSEIFGLLDCISFLEKKSKSALKHEKVPTPLALMGKSSYIQYEPRGVVLIISPWNYPFYQMMAPALFSFIAGNATVVKPSEHTPLNGLVEDILALAGFHNHDIQLAYGDGKVGVSAIHEKPDYISFTGSVSTGKKVMSLASQYLIPIELELGGKDPMIVFRDVNLTRTVSGALWGAFTNSGQSCSSIERILVDESIAPEFTRRLIEGINKVGQQNTNPKAQNMGAMTLMNEAQKVHGLVEDALKKGAKKLTKAQWDMVSPRYPMTVLTDISDNMRISHEEIFGPVVTIETFSSEEEAIKKANLSDFGLSASIWTTDLLRARRVSSQINTGNVSINNVMLTEGNANLPFGGCKNSGIGRIKGVQGLRSLCNTKSIIIDKQSKKVEANWYPYSTKKYDLFGALLAGFKGGVFGLFSTASAGLRIESLSQKDSP